MEVLQTEYYNSILLAIGIFSILTSLLMLAFFTILTNYVEERFNEISEKLDKLNEKETSKV